MLELAHVDVTFTRGYAANTVENQRELTLITAMAMGKIDGRQSSIGATLVFSTAVLTSFIASTQKYSAGTRLPDLVHLPFTKYSSADTVQLPTVSIAILR